jgi:acetyltransferase-like isoleucine patch superfamily enzyme
LKPLLLITNAISSLIKLAIYLSVYVGAVLAYIFVNQTYGLTAALVALPVILALSPFAVLILTFVFRILIPRPKVGVHKLGGGSHFLYQLNHRIFDLSIKSIFPPFSALYKNSDIFRILTLKCCGARVKLSVRVGHTTQIHDPYLLTLGTGATVDEGVQIHSSAVEVEKIILKRVFIGPKAHVGASTLIFPGTEISEGSILGMGSSTRNDMRIPQYELWVGSPASHLSRLSRSLLYTSSQVKEHREDRPRSNSGNRYSSGSRDGNRGPSREGRVDRADGRRGNNRRPSGGGGYGDSRRRSNSGPSGGPGRPRQDRDRRPAGAASGPGGRPRADSAGSDRPTSQRPASDRPANQRPADDRPARSRTPAVKPDVAPARTPEAPKEAPATRAPKVIVTTQKPRAPQTDSPQPVEKPVQRSVPAEAPKSEPIKAPVQTEVSKPAEKPVIKPVQTEAPKPVKVAEDKPAKATETPYIGPIKR